MRFLSQKAFIEYLVVSYSRQKASQRNFKKDFKRLLAHLTLHKNPSKLSFIRKSVYSKYFNRISSFLLESTWITLNCRDYKVW